MIRRGGYATRVSGKGGATLLIRPPSLHGPSTCALHCGIVPTPCLPASRCNHTYTRTRPCLQEGLPFVALGSYTLALLLRHLLQLQSSRATPQVLQPTAIRAPGRHTREVRVRA